MFLIIPVAVDYRARRHPVVTYTIMGLCALVYVISFLVWLSGGNEADYEFVLRFGFVREELNWYSWFSHMFTHADIFHLLGNMAYLYLFGSCVEDLLGRGKYVAFYLLGGLAALGVYLLLAPPASDKGILIPLVGASGAISACMGAFSLVLHRTSINLK